MATVALVAQPHATEFRILERSGTTTAYRITGPNLPTEGQWVEVLPGDFTNNYVGRTVSAELLDRGDGTQLLAQIFPMDPLDAPRMAQINANLRRSTVERGRRVMRTVGEFIPEFALWNEEGTVVTNETFRGKYLVMNFIFSRCPTPEMCPAQTMRMARLQRSLNETGIHDQVELISFTLDPDYDSPGILREYGETRGLDLKNFSLLTGSKRAMEDLWRQFGIIAFDAEGTIEHTVATILVSPMGKILYRRDGSRWSAEDFEKRLVEALQRL